MKGKDMNISNSSMRLTQSLFDLQKGVSQEQQMNTQRLDNTKEAILAKSADRIEQTNKVAQQRADTNNKIANKIDVYA